MTRRGGHCGRTKLGKAVEASEDSMKAGPSPARNYRTRKQREKSKESRWGGQCSVKHKTPGSKAKCKYLAVRHLLLWPNK